MVTWKWVKLYLQGFLPSDLEGFLFNAKKLYIKTNVFIVDIFVQFLVRVDHALGRMCVCIHLY